jgi:hypothetical protein
VPSVGGEQNTTEAKDTPTILTEHTLLNEIHCKARIIVSSCELVVTA